MQTLMYHDIAPRGERERVGFPGPLAARYKLEPETFESHLDALARTGLRVAELCAVDDDSSPAPQVLISFDDGGRSALLAASSLERRGWRGSFFITTGRIGTPGFLAAAEVCELQARGHVVGGHSHTHPTYMGKLSREQLDLEWARSREVLAETLGSPPRSASVPGGYLSRDVIAAAAAAGYELLFTSEPTARVQQLELTVRGRYTIRSTTPARIAAAYARGRRVACGRVWLEWNAKKLVKHVSPASYQALRRVRAGRG
jgi:peptidoglycan/xylan/chitin deacetylase (PgdA/CDA1 family)